MAEDTGKRFADRREPPRGTEVRDAPKTVPRRETMHFGHPSMRVAGGVAHEVRWTMVCQGDPAGLRLIAHRQRAV